MNTSESNSNFGMDKIIGRDAGCDLVIFDPKNRVSRKHAVVRVENGIILIRDNQSLNGTFVNGIRISPERFSPVSSKDVITLSSDYRLEWNLLLSAVSESPSGSADDDQTMVLNGGQASFKDGKKTVVFDRDKTSIGEMVYMDRSPYVTLGRAVENKIRIDSDGISRHHCRIRMLTPIMVEIEDLGSTNGTFADDERLPANIPQLYASPVNIRLGKTHRLDLKKIFPGIQMVARPRPLAPPGLVPQGTPSAGPRPVSPDEMAAFLELEGLWQEYTNRQNEANNAGSGFAIGGSILGAAGALLLSSTGVGALFAIGGGILGRYLGQQKSNKIRQDLTFENAFLEAYCCPRCQESFQKKPWVTIRECFKCKAKFR